MPEFPALNVDIIECFKKAFQVPQIFQNPSFYISTVSFVLSILGALIAIPNNLSIINNSFSSLLKSDAKFFNPEEMTVEDYFGETSQSKYNGDNLKNMQEDINFVEGSKNIQNLKQKIQIDIQDRAIQPANVWCPKYKKVKFSEVKKSDISDISSEGAGAITLGQYEENKTDIKDKDYKKDEFSSPSNNNIKENQINDDIRNFIIFKSKINLEDNNENSFSDNRSSRPFTIALNNKAGQITNMSSQTSSKNKNFHLVKELGQYKDRPHQKREHEVTLRDYEELSPSLAVKYEKRKFSTLLWDFLQEEQMIIWVLFKKSIFNPLWVRIVYLVFNLSIAFALNAIFFSDDYIDQRATVPKDERVYIFLIILMFKT